MQWSNILGKPNLRNVFSGIVQIVFAVQYHTDLIRMMETKIKFHSEVWNRPFKFSTENLSWQISNVGQYNTTNDIIKSCHCQLLPSSLLSKLSTLTLSTVAPSLPCSAHVMSIIFTFQISEAKYLHKNHLKMFWECLWNLVRTPSAGKCKKYFQETISDLEFYQNLPETRIN